MSADTRFFIEIAMGAVISFVGVIMSISWWTFRWSMKNSWDSVIQGQNAIRNDLGSIREDIKTLFERTNSHAQSIAIIETKLSTLLKNTMTFG